MSRSATGSEPEALLDTVAIVADVADFDRSGARAAVTDFGGERETWTWSRSLPGGGQLMTGIAGRGRLELSLPKRVAEDNVRALPLGEALDVLADAYKEAGEFASFTVPVHRAEVRRLDVVREFDDVHQFPLWASGIRAVKQSGRSVVSMHHDGELGNALTIKVGAGTSWNSYAYDKFAESKGRAPAGRVRYEARMRGPVLRSKFAADRGGVVLQVRDINESKLQVMRRALFERSGFDREVVGMDEAVRRVHSSSLTNRQKGTLLAHLVGRAYNENLFHRSTLWRLEKTIADHGLEDLNITVPVEALQGMPTVVQLDYQTGRELVRAA